MKKIIFGIFALCSLSVSATDLIVTQKIDRYFSRFEIMRFNNCKSPIDVKIKMKNEKLQYSGQESFFTQNETIENKDFALNSSEDYEISLDQISVIRAEPRWRKSKADFEVIDVTIKGCSEESTHQVIFSPELNAARLLIFKVKDK